MANALDGDKVYIDPDRSLYSDDVLGVGDKAYLDTNNLGWMDQTWFVNGINHWSDRMFVDSFGQTIISSNSTNIVQPFSNIPHYLPNGHEMVGVGNAKYGWVDHDSFGLIYLVPDVYLIYLDFYWKYRLNDVSMFRSSPYWEDTNQLYYLGDTGTDYDFLGLSSIGVWVWFGQSRGFSGGYNAARGWIYFNRESICDGGVNYNSSSKFSNTGITSHTNNQGVMGMGSFWLSGTVKVEDFVVTGTSTNFTQEIDECRVIYISQPNNKFTVHRVIEISSSTQCLISPGIGINTDGTPITWENRKIGKEGLIYFVSNGSNFYVRNHNSNWSQVDPAYKLDSEIDQIEGYGI